MPKPPIPRSLVPFSSLTGHAFEPLAVASADRCHKSLGERSENDGSALGEIERIAEKWIN